MKSQNKFINVNFDLVFRGEFPGVSYMNSKNNLLGHFSLSEAPSYFPFDCFLILQLRAKVWLCSPPLPLPTDSIFAGGGGISMSRRKFLMPDIQISAIHVPCPLNVIETNGNVEFCSQCTWCLGFFKYLLIKAPLYPSTYSFDKHMDWVLERQWGKKQV